MFLGPTGVGKYDVIKLTLANASVDGSEEA